VHDRLQEPADPGFARNLASAYQDSLGREPMMSNELYLTLLYRPNVSRVSRAFQPNRRSRAEIAKAQKRPNRSSESAVTPPPIP